MRIAILGAGGHAKVVLDAASTCGTFSIAGCLDDDALRKGTLCSDARVLGDIAGWRDHALDGLVPGIGHNRSRQMIVSRLEDDGAVLVSVVHPAATASPSARIGRGTVVMAGAVVNSCASIEADVIVNTGAIVEHDCVVEAHSHLAPASCLAGNVRIGEGAFIGMGARVLPGCSVGAWAVVGAGAVVTRDVPGGAVVAGIPARSLR